MKGLMIISIISISALKRTTLTYYQDDSVFSCKYLVNDKTEYCFPEEGTELDNKNRFWVTRW